MLRVLILLCCVAGPALPDVIVPTRTIRAQEVIGPGDLLLKPGEGAGPTTLADLIGMEARVALYPGRPVLAHHVQPPTLIERNQIVPLIYAHGGLQILTEGRALSRAGAGEYVRVMNLGSRATVTGRVTDDGRIAVSR
ncbi:flagellar basal body P-ring biosynthesis protein FlgA [Roseovarius sp. A-2]|uniref:flagellar basal body P-ring formation chaperone FlgA n=1 Tax=Roseovarius sp. A-2 TaxID=1570360 RepID=UPI0009B4FCAC|nr:flagellar basal body P-ring formation chaperone FlgA [Roseovarius sp. A-2]GAW36409.1 flagellar basal body P-ring biosynthesis protein FlgA [Roseovarius sp. A-2]